MVRGEEEAFNLLYDRYYTRLYRYLLVVSSGDETMAQEALQEAMVRVAGKIKPMASADYFWRWLTTVARNAHRDMIRRQGRYRGMLRRFSEWFSIAQQDALLIPPQNAEQLYEEMLRGVIDSLPKEDRILVIGKYF